MIIDNFQQIGVLLDFKDDDTFYHLQILMRRKEHPSLGRNSVCLRTYYVKSLSHFDKIRDEVIKMCEAFNARAYINLNARSFRLAALKTNEKIASQLMNDDYKSVRNAYNSAIGYLVLKKVMVKDGY